jgi:hypothetical protein
MIRVEAGSSSPYLVLNLVSSSSVKRSFLETELVEIDRIFVFTAKVRGVSFFPFSINWGLLRKESLHT